jgi:hypothetical protein
VYVGAARRRGAAAGETAKKQKIRGGMNCDVSGWLLGRRA